MGGGTVKLFLSFSIGITVIFDPIFKLRLYAKETYFASMDTVMLSTVWPC